MAEIMSIDELLKQDWNGYYAYLVYTNEIRFIKGEKISKDWSTELLLECRIFNRNEEIRYKRSGINKEFKMREKNDSKLNADEYFDKSYFLDIDMKKGFEGGIVATGGIKRYPLPIDVREKKISDGVIAANKLKIRYYLGYYEETGQAYIKDWRLVGFVNDGEEK